MKKNIIFKQKLYEYTIHMYKRENNILYYMTIKIGVLALFDIINGITKNLG